MTNHKDANNFYRFVLSKFFMFVNQIDMNIDIIQQCNLYRFVNYALTTSLLLFHIS